MRKLVDVLNHKAPDAEYPKGDIQDKSTGVLGTEVGRSLFGDIVQFFQKLVIDSGITENDLPDNVTNDYQLLEAAIKTMGVVFSAHVEDDGTISKQKGVIDFTLTRTAQGVYEINEIVSEVANLNLWNIQVTPIFFDGQSKSFAVVYVPPTSTGKMKIHTYSDSGILVDTDFYINISKL